MMAGMSDLKYVGPAIGVEPMTLRLRIRSVRFLQLNKFQSVAATAVFQGFYTFLYGAIRNTYVSI
jgi:hypothetical protein